MSAPNGRVPLLVVVGPTAAGKSEAAVQLCLALDGEVVSADSVQVFRRFNVGTGKLSVEEQRGVAHHLIDVAEPDEAFSAARFVELADAAIAQIHGRGRRAVVAGGTGLYVRALLHGLFDAPAPDPSIRERHARVKEERGLSALYEELRRVDAASAARINPADFVRISRALEVFEQTGRPISELQRAHGFAKERYPALWIGIAPRRDLLRERIDRRVDWMMERGWLEEVRLLLEAGYGASPPMGSLGYRQLRAHLRGELGLDEAVRQTKRDTWRFARRQLTWFRSERNLRWYEEPLAPLEDLASLRV